MNCETNLCDGFFVSIFTFAPAMSKPLKKTAPKQEKKLTDFFTTKTNASVEVVTPNVSSSLANNETYCN